MCEYCGCQVIPAIERLTTEHDRALDHARDVETAARGQDANAARVAAAALADLLAPHLAVEEQALFPAIVADYPEHVRDLLDEHDLIEQSLDDMSCPQLEPGWDRRLLHAMELLRGHIRKEQDGVFPAALAILGPDDWDRLDQVREQFSRKGNRS